MARRGLVRDRILVEGIEGALICELQPAYNSCKRNSYSLRYDLDIASKGDRGAIPRRVNTERHDWAGAV